MVYHPPVSFATFPQSNSVAPNKAATFVPLNYPKMKERVKVYTKKVSTHNLLQLIMLSVMIMLHNISYGQQSDRPIVWPEGKKVAVSLSFDDGRMSQVDRGTTLLDQYGVKATFYLVPGAVEQRLEGWKKATASGHEIGNHSLNHPCTGNFPWARQKALENYTLEQMRAELVDANKKIETLLGVKPEVFAYPCGQTFVGRGTNTRSYIPLVADLFLTGRGWLDEGPNDPAFCDFAQLTGMEMDGKNFEDILPLIENASKNQQWLVLAGHEMGDSGSQTTRLSMLKSLIEYAQDPAHGIWLAPVGTVARYIQQKKK
jgi:peptidoglycan-N-acetylglucosamine deacetylase